MPRLMYDSTNPYDIPAGAGMVAGYVDGLYAWSDAGWARFRNATLVRITAVSGTLDADVIDVESGDFSPAEGAAWIKAKQARGEVGAIYASVSRLPEIHDALSALGLNPYAGWNYWAALWDGLNEQWDGAVAHQYANPTITGAHYDLSWVADFWEGIDPVAPPAPAYGPAVEVLGWNGLTVKLDVDLPAFGQELGVLSSAVQSLG